MKQFIVAIITLVYVTGLVQCGQRIDIILSGRDIPSFDAIWGETEPYIKVYYKFDTNSNWISYGETTVSKSNPNPDWPQVFTFDYTGGLNQIVKYEMFDKDVIWHDKIGLVEVKLGDIVKNAIEGGGNRVERAFVPSGRGRLLMKVRIDGTIP